MNLPVGPAPRPPRRLPPDVAPGMPPAASPPAPRPPGPSRVLRALADRLGQHGLTHLYGAADAGLGVLSLPQVTVWCYGHTLTWTYHGRATTMPASDLISAATSLAALGAPATRPPPAPCAAYDL
jgi:hypothetical protein